MEKYRIANIRVDMQLYYNRLRKQAVKYLCDANDNTKAEITINLSKDFYQKRLEENPHLNIDSIEYIFAGSYFYNHILDFDGFLLHSSAICKDNNAYLFSADSGTGKSTHTLNWLKYFGKDNVTYINDDKPAIRKIENKFYCCGTPFSGKTNLSKNILIPIRAIIFIKRGVDNSIKLMNSKDAISKIFGQTIFTNSFERMNKLLTLLDDLLKTIPVFELTCNMDVTSAKVAYEGIEEYYNNK